MVTPDPFDPEALRDRRPTPKPKPRLPRPGPAEAFLGGPIPMGWIERAVGLPGKAWHLACALWFQGIRSRDKCSRVHLTLKTMRRFRLSRWALYRGLTSLERAGLIHVERTNKQR